MCAAENVLSSEVDSQVTNNTLCTEADAVKCTTCTFWNAPTASGDGCVTHAVWWVVVLAVAVNSLTPSVKAREQQRKTCVFLMARSKSPLSGRATGRSASEEALLRSIARSPSALSRRHSCS